MSEIAPNLERLEPRRLLATFGQDSTFGVGGVAHVDGNHFIRALSDGKILAAGDHVVPTNSSEDYWPDYATFSRLNPDGSLDTTFANGAGTLNFGDVSDPENFLVTATASRIYVVARSGLDAYTTDGLLDPTFGDNGHAPPSSFPDINGAGTEIDATPDGGVMICSGDSITKLLHDGSVDASFADRGQLRLAESAGIDSGDGVTIGPSGFLVLSDATINGEATATLYKFDGSVDTSFGTGGRVSLAGYPGNPFFQGDGKLLYTGIGSDRKTRLNRLNTSGTPDTSFGTGGSAIVPSTTGSGFNDFASIDAINLDAQGRIVLIGHTIYRYSTTGVLDARPLNGTLRRRDGTDIDVGSGFDDTLTFDRDGNVLVGGANVIRFANLAPISLGADHTLYLNGGGGNDDVIIAPAAGGKVAVTMNGKTSSLAAADVQRIDAQLGDGNNHFAELIDAPASVQSGAGDDTIFTGGGSDTIDAGDGDDSVHAGGGSDVVYAGDGADRIFGDDGHDTLDGNGGNDRIEGGAQPDIIRGNGGRDKLFGNGGNDRLYGGAGGDWITGQAGNDQIFGEGGNDRLYGDDSYSDTLSGGGGDDVFITLDAVTDRLFGDGGHDRATADAADLLTSIETLA